MSTSSHSCTSEGTSNISRDFPPNLTFDKCPRCKMQFDSHKRVNVSRVPLILPCNHTVCEDCIRRMCFANCTICNVCKEKFSLVRSQLDSLTDLFPLHFTIMGYVCWIRSCPFQKEMNLVPTGFTLKNKCVGSGDLTDLDMTTKSDSELEGCEKTSVSLVFDKCQEHIDQYINISCEECGDVYCCYCFLENHVGHQASYLFKLNDAEKIKLGKLRMDVEVILAELLKSKRKVKDVKCFAPNVDQEIKNYFSTLHAKVLVAERNIRQKLTSMESEEGDVTGMNRMINSEIWRVKNVINHFHLLESKQLNVRALLEEAEEIKEIPCRLVSNQGYLRPIEFITDRVFDDIEDKIHIKNLSNLEYNLMPVEDWTDAQVKYDFEQMKRQTEASSQEERKIPTPGLVKLSKHSANEARKSNEGKIRVVVTHINNLNSFFIQKHSTLESLKDFNNIIAKKGRRNVRVEEIKIGSVYGVAYEAKGSVYWRRGKLLDYNRKDDKVLYKVFFIDYGNTQNVTKEKLKELDLYTIRRHPYAYECALANFDDDSFDENAHLRLLQIIGQKELYIRGLKLNEHHTTQEVELLVAASNGGLISVRDLLLKTPRAVPETKEIMLLSELKLFNNSKQFTVGQVEDVSVVYVEHPHYICVQSERNVEFMRKLKDDMEAYYKNQPLINCIPVANTDVVVKYEDEIRGNWHRARIISVDVAAKEVDVYFVDWGKNVAVSWSHLRLLTQEFIKAECLGIIVKLADIQKLNMEEPWKPEAVTFLRQNIATNDKCRMVVSQVEPLEVALFQAGPSVDLCLNSLMVEECYAMSTGKISETTYWPNITDPPPKDDDDFSFQIVKKSEEILMADDEDPHLKSGMRLQVNVVHFENPNLIHVKFVKTQDEEHRLHKELQIHYCAKNTKRKESWKVDETCIVFDRDRHSYFRAVIKSKVKNDLYKVYLYDHLRELQVKKKNLYIQDPYFASFDSYVYKCRLSHIKPAGDAGTWSQLATEMLEKIFAMHKTIYIKRVECNLEAKTLGVIMWYCLTTPTKALEPSRVKLISINQSLIESGVAFSAALTNDSTPSHSETPKKQMWYDLIREDEESNLESKDESSDDEEAFETLYQDGWLKPLKLNERKFVAILTCVDNNGFFYVRDEKIHSCYIDLEEKLTSTFSRMQLPSDDSRWEENDMCTLRDEGKWYRGTVLYVKSTEEICVEMIDFGSAHIVSANDLTRSLMFTDCPPFVHKLRLYDVYAKHETWLPDDVNKVLDIVTDNVNIDIKGNMNIEVPYAEIYLDNGKSLNDLITLQCPHMTRRKNIVILGTADDCNLPTKDDDDIIEAGIIKQETEFNEYTYDCLPSFLNDRKKLCVVSILKWDAPYYVVLSSNENLATLEEFVDLTNTLQEEGKSQAVLEKVEMNTPCVCLQPQKQIWSRAVVYGVTSLPFGFVLAFFVDYGTVEMVAVANLREMRREWFYLPVYMQIACINIELLIHDKSEKVLTQLNNLRGKSVSVEIASESPIKVHLYDDEDNLCYEDFVVGGVVKAL